MYRFRAIVYTSKRKVNRNCEATLTNNVLDSYAVCLFVLVYKREYNKLFTNNSELGKKTNKFCCIQNGAYVLTRDNFFLCLWIKGPFKRLRFAQTNRLFTIRFFQLARMTRTVTAAINAYYHLLQMIIASFPGWIIAIAMAVHLRANHTTAASKCLISIDLRAFARLSLFFS